MFPICHRYVQYVLVQWMLTYYTFMWVCLSEKMKCLLISSWTLKLFNVGSSADPSGSRGPRVSCLWLTFIIAVVLDSTSLTPLLSSVLHRSGFNSCYILWSYSVNISACPSPFQCLSLASEWWTWMQQGSFSQEAVLNGSLPSRHTH